MTSKIVKLRLNNRLFNGNRLAHGEMETEARLAEIKRGMNCFAGTIPSP
jgi:hypothetical protein